MEGGQKWRKGRWREKGEGARWEGEEGQAIVLNMEGIEQACVIGVYCTGLRSHIPFPRQPLSR